tara:strand:+ start:1091 stop:1498 length:408 start_codon:yes stop_codon:yes gene_type:complete
MLPGAIYSGIDNSRQYEVGEPGFKKSQLRPRSKRGSGIFDAINENLKRKGEISYETKEKAKQAKNLAEQFKSGSTKISDDATVVEGYRDPGFSLTQEGSAGFGGLIGTVGGAIVGGAMGNPMMGAQLGGKVGSYF